MPAFELLLQGFLFCKVCEIFEASLFKDMANSWVKLGRVIRVAGQNGPGKKQAILNGLKMGLVNRVVGWVGPYFHI